MKKTGPIDKLIPSSINVVIVLCISLPFLHIFDAYQWKLLVVGIFFLYNLVFLIFNDNRCLGMILYGTHWKRKVSLWHECIYIILYTVSFSTIFMRIWFPFDVLLINLLILQLPSIVVTGTTLHGYLSGEKSSIIKQK